MNYYELFANKENNNVSAWHNSIQELTTLIGHLKKFKIIIELDYNMIRYYLKTNTILPTCLNTGIFLKKNLELISLKGRYNGIYFNNCQDNFISIANNLKKKNKNLKRMELTLINYEKTSSFKYRITIYYEYHNNIYQKNLLFKVPINILSIDFQNCKNFIYKELPKYLKIDKVMHLLDSSDTHALLRLDTFPYLEGNYYLKHFAYDFNRHSLVIGSSGSGKSKFLALLINNIYRINASNYKVVVIDPHDSLKDDLGGIDSNIIDFKNESVDIFKNDNLEINAMTEDLFSLFSSLIPNFNGKMARVLRFSIYILLWDKSFNFQNLRTLLLDMDYRNELINRLKREIPTSVSYFFLNDFNELKTNSYSEAISPIIAFIDEFMMVPIFNETTSKPSIKDIISSQFLTVFSLNRLTLGDNVTKTIAGIIMEQIFLEAIKNKGEKNLILVLDEVAVIENPILIRLLSEARKFGIGLIIAGQYFNQISSNLQNAILANTANYYLFRLTNKDAHLISNNLEFKLANGDSEEDKIKLMTNLNRQECLVGISKNGLTYPIFKAKTMEFNPPKILQESKPIETQKDIINKKFNFKIDSNITINDIMKSNSTSRKEVI